MCGAALLGGVSGFGFSPTGAPLPLALRFPLVFVVPMHRTIAVLTRTVVARYHEIHM